ncbi:putative RNA recognition motif domain, nucleotide-binding alpha-beta plait domain superfamily [Helianthus annuus]|nr:putative RNA recognition motif domain, nucleotide-binding alpha-beta plait domain superfamily [Helianthus annuus]
MRIAPYVQEDFIGGLAKDATIDTFVKYFGKYGDLTDSVIMKDRQTGRLRGFGFVTYADPLVVDTVIAETHVINGKQVSEFLFLCYFGYE